MENLSLPSLLCVFLTFVLAGFVKGVSGMGLPTVAMAILGTIMPPPVAAALLIAPSFVTNVWQLFTGPAFKALLSRFSLLLIGIVIGTILGAGILTSGDGRGPELALGAALAAYAAIGLLNRQPAVAPGWERYLSPAVGLVTGAVAGATGVFVMPAVPYLQSLGLKKDELVQALGLSFTISTIALAAVLGADGALRMGGMATSLAAIVPALLGMWAGQSVRARISQTAFRRWFLLCLGVLGLQLIVRAAFGLAEG